MIGALPIAELHVHLEGTLSPALARTLAARHGAVAQLPPFDWLTPEYRWRDPLTWLATMRRVGNACLRTPADYVDAFRDYTRRLAAEGAIYAEVSVSLSRVARGDRDDLSVLAAVCDAAAEAPLPVGIIAAFNGTAEPADTVLQLRAALDHKLPCLTGVDLHGIRGKPSTAFAALFGLAAASGLGRRAHAGEFEGPASIWQALELGVERIAHGVRAIEDESLMERLVGEKVVLDICPGSNLALGLFPDMARHPLRRLVDAGVRVTLSSDDPFYFGCSARGEYERAARHGFAAHELLAMTRTAIEASFAGPELRGRLLSGLGAAPQPA